MSLARLRRDQGKVQMIDTLVLNAREYKIDGIRGGSPFTDERVQGFATGLFTDSSDFTNQNPPKLGQQGQMLHYSDWIRIG